MALGHEGKAHEVISVAFFFFPTPTRCGPEGLHFFLRQRKAGQPTDNKPPTGSRVVADCRSAR